MNKFEKGLLLISEAAATAATVYIVWRLFAGPDGSRRFTMRVAKLIEKRSMKNAQSWANIADRAALVYEKHRNVNV